MESSSNTEGVSGAEQTVSLRVAKDDLADAVAWVARNLPAKAPQPVLRAMLITAYDDGLELVGFDYEVSTRVRIPAEVAEPGRIAVAGKLIAEITNTLPNKPVDFTVNGSKLVIACSSSRFELPLIPLDDYPPLPNLPEVTGSIDAKLFTQATSQVSVAAGKDDTLPMLTGVNVEINGEDIRMAATDRFRLGLRTLKWNPTSPDVKARLLIPAKTLQENARTLDTSGGKTVDIAVGTGDQVGSEGLFGVHADARETTTRMLDAEYPNIEPLIPQFHNSMATVEISPLLEAIRRVSLVADRSSQLRMEFSQGEVILSAGGTDSGHAEESLPCAFNGEDNFIIAFNSAYLKDGLSVIGTDRVVFGFTQTSRPAILIPEPEELTERNDDGQFPTPETNFIYLLMPVRLPG